MKPNILMPNLLSALLLAGGTTPSPLRGGLATEAHMTRNNAGLTSALG